MEEADMHMYMRGDFIGFLVMGALLVVVGALGATFTRRANRAHKLPPEWRDPDWARGGTTWKTR